MQFNSTNAPDSRLAAGILTTENLLLYTAPSPFYLESFSILNTDLVDVRYSISILSDGAEFPLVHNACVKAGYKNENIIVPEPLKTGDKVFARGDKVGVLHYKICGSRI